MSAANRHFEIVMYERGLIVVQDIHALGVVIAARAVRSAQQEARKRVPVVARSAPAPEV